MTDTRPHDIAPASSAPDSESRKRRRTYKACFACRSRKGKCELNASGVPPCLRCRRELRECVFPEHRAAAPRMASSGNAPHRDSEGAGADVPRREQSMVAPYGDTPAPVPASDHDQALLQSVVRTVVSSGNDALNVLFQAALEQRDRNQASTGKASRTQAPNTSPHDRQPALPATTSVPQYKLNVWRRSRLVRAGWLTAEEAVMYVDRFFTQLAPLTPIFHRHTCQNPDHWHLVATEPFLCCVILMISARYHRPAILGGVTRSDALHEHLWQKCQHFIMRVILARDDGPPGGMRTLGAVEAFILLSEWHPRALHFPLSSDGMDLELLCPDERERTADGASYTVEKLWQGDVGDVSRRSDRMSWMLLGCALSLAHELDVFVDGEEQSNSEAESMGQQRLRIARLLYIYINQLALRQGSTSTLPNLSSGKHSLLLSISDSREPYLKAWADLTGILESFHDKVFAHKDQFEHILQSHRYRRILDSYRPLLLSWKEHNMENLTTSPKLRDLLAIEYDYSVLYVNSIGIQAACERAYLKGGDRLVTSIPLNSVEQSDVQTVISHSCELLDRIARLAEDGILRYAPVRTFLRVTTTSVVLIKTLACGVRRSQFDRAVKSLDAAVAALRSSAVDDVHVANGYASLLQSHLERVQKRVRVQSEEPAFQHGSDHRSRQRGLSPALTHLNAADTEEHTRGHDPMDAPQSATSFTAIGTGTDEWMSIPFDPAIDTMFPDGFLIAPTPMFQDFNPSFDWNV